VAVEFDVDVFQDRRVGAGDGRDLAAAVDRDRRVFVLGQAGRGEAAVGGQDQVADPDLLGFGGTGEEERDEAQQRCGQEPVPPKVVDQEFNRCPS